MRLGLTVFFAVLAALLVFSLIGFLTASALPMMDRGDPPETVQPPRPANPTPPPTVTPPG